MAVTRIKNNQITDSTITYEKIASGTLVGSNFNANVTLNSNLTIIGNLSVSGTTSTVSSTNTYVNDPIVVFNNGYTGSLTGYDIGILVNRNLGALSGYGSVNAAFVWSEADAAFIAITTTDTGTGITSLNNSGFANVKLGNVTVPTVITGGLQAVAIGNVTPGTGAFTTLTASGTTLGLTSAAAINSTPIGNATPSSGAFTTGTFSSTLGVTGETTMSTATAGGLQAKAIGNVTPGTGAFSTLSATGLTYVSSTATSTSANTGAAVIAGGVGIGGNLNVGGFTTLIGNVTIGGNLTVTGQSVSIGASSLSIVDPIISLNTPADLSPLTSATTSDIGVKFHYYDTADSAAFLGRAVDTGSLEWYARGTDTANVFTGTAYGTIKTGALWLANTTTSTSTTTGALRVSGGAGIAGNLNVGTSVVVDSGAYGNVTTTQFASVFGAGSGANPYSVMQVRSSDGVSGLGMQAYTGSATLYASTAINVITNATVRDRDVYSGGTVSTIFAANGAIINTASIASTSGDTGALIVKTGGLGVGGNVFAAKAATFNSSQTSGMDFKVAGVSSTNLLWAKPGTYDQVLIGNSAAVSEFVGGAKLQINSTDSILLPAGTNAQRPSSVGETDVAGMFRYSTTSNAIEWYTGSAWQAATTSFTVIADQQFNGDGTTTVYTLSEAQTTNSCIVSINGVIQIPTSAYAVTSGTTLTFTEAPASGDVIDVRKLTTTSTVTGIASTNGYMQVQIDNNGVYVYTGTASTAATTYWDTTGGEVNSRANVTASGTADTLLDSFTNTVYSSGEYIITATIPGTNIRETAKILIVQDGTTATRVVYGVVSTAGNALVTYSANISAGATRIYGTPANAGTIFRVKKDYQAI